MLLTRTLKQIVFTAVLFGGVALFAVNPAQAGPGDTVTVSRTGNDEVTIRIFEGVITSNYDTFEYYQITRRLNGDQQLGFVTSENMLSRGAISSVVDTPPDYNAEYLYDVWGTTFIESCEPGDYSCNDLLQNSEYNLLGNNYLRVFKIGSATLPAVSTTPTDDDNTDKITVEIRADFRICQSDGTNCKGLTTFGESVTIKDANGNTLDKLTNINSPNDTTGLIDLNLGEQVTISASNNSGLYYRMTGNGINTTNTQYECYVEAIAYDGKCGTAGEFGEHGVIDSVKLFAANIWNSVTGKSNESITETILEITAADLIANGGSITVTPEYRYSPADPDFSISPDPISRTFTTSGQTQCFAVSVVPQNGFDKNRVTLTATSVDPSFSYTKTDAMLSENGNTYDDGEVCFTLNSNHADFSDVVTINGTASGVRRTNPNTGVISYETVTRSRNVTLVLNNAPSAIIEARQPGGAWTRDNLSFTSNSRNIELRAVNVTGFAGSCTDVMFGRNGQIFDATVVPSHNGTTSTVSTFNPAQDQSYNYTVTCDGGSALDTVSVRVNSVVPDPSGTLEVQHPTNGWSTNPSPWSSSSRLFNIRTTNVQNCGSALYYKRQGNNTTLATRGTPDYEAPLNNPSHGVTYTYTVQCGSSGTVFDTIDVSINQPASPSGTLEVQRQDGSWDSNSPTTVYNSVAEVTLRTTNLQNCPSGRVNYYDSSNNYLGSSSNSTNSYLYSFSHNHGQTITYYVRCHGDNTNMSNHQVTLLIPDYSASFSPTNLNYTAVGQKQCVDVIVFPQNGYSEDLILSSGSVPAFVSTSFDNGLFYRANEYNNGVTKTICFTLDSEPPRNDTFTVTANTSEFSPTENTESRSINLNVNITSDLTGTIQAQDNNGAWHSSSLVYESASKDFNLRSINVANCSDNLVYKRSGSSESKTTNPALGGTGPIVGFTVPTFGQTYTYTVHCGSSINSMSQVNVRINEAVSTVDTNQYVYSQTTSGSAIQSSWNATVRIDSTNTAINGSNQTMNSRVITANDPDTGTTSFTLNGVTPPSGYVFDSVQVYSGPPGRGSCGSPSSSTTTSLNDSLSWTGKCNLTALVKFTPNPIVDYTVTTRIVDVNGDPVVSDWQNSVSVGNQSENRSVNNNSSAFITLSVPQSDPNSSSYSINSLDFPNNFVFGPSSSIRVGNPIDGCSYRTSNNPSASFNWSSKCDLVATITLEKAPNYEISIDPEITIIAGVTGDQCTTLTVQTDENTSGTVTVDFNFDSNNADTNAIRVNYDRSFNVTSSRAYDIPVCFEVDERIGRGLYGYQIDTNSDIVGGDGNTVRHNVRGTLDVKNIPDGSVIEN